MTADIHHTDNDATQHHDPQDHTLEGPVPPTDTTTDTTTTATTDADTTTPTDADTTTPTDADTTTTTTLSKDTAIATVAPKRGRGRPRKSDTVTVAHTSAGVQGLANGPTGVMGAAGTASTSIESGLTGQQSTVPLDTAYSTDSQCESCMADGVRLFKFGKLRICKECERLMRFVTGSSRRQTVNRPITPSTSRLTTSTATAKDESVLSIASAPESHMGATADSDLPKHEHAQFDPVSHFSSISHSTFDPSITTIAPSSLVLFSPPSTAPVAPILTKKGEIAKKRGRKPKLKDDPANSLSATAHGDSLAQASTAGQVVPLMAAKKRGRKPKALYPMPSNSHTDQPSSVVVIKTKSATYVESLVSVTINTNLPSPTAAQGSSSSSHDDTFNFQTTGAFLTRTASKLLGGQEVTGVDSNIHGYAHGRLVKVQHIDKSWHFGAMVGLDRGKIKIHYDGWGPEWDEWIASDSRRLKVLDADEIAFRSSLLQAPPQLSQSVKEAVGGEPGPPHPPVKVLVAIQPKATLQDISRPQTELLPTKPSKFKKPTSVKRKLAPSMEDVVPALMVVDPDLPRAHIKAIKKIKTLDLINQTISGPASSIPPKLKKIKADNGVPVTTPSAEGLTSATSAPVTFKERDPVLILPKPTGIKTVDLSLPKALSTFETTTTNKQAQGTLLSSNPTIAKAVSITGPPKPVKLIAIAPKGSTVGNIFASQDATGTTPDKPPKLTLADARKMLVGIDIGTKVKAQDKSGQWQTSTVVQIKARRVLVHYDGYPDQSDEWLIADSARLILPKRPTPEPSSHEGVAPVTSRSTSSLETSALTVATDLKRRDSAWSPPIDVEALSSCGHPDSSRSSSSSSSSLSTPKSSLSSSASTIEVLSSSSDDLSELSSTVSLSDDPPERVAAKDDEPPPPPAPRPPHTLGNPILLDLPPYEIVAFEFEDQEKELLRIIHQVLDTGLIKNAVIEYPPEEYIPPVRISKKKKKAVEEAAVEGVAGEGAADGEGGTNEAEGEDDDEIEVGKETSKRTNTKTKERFMALMEARQERMNHRPSIFSPRKTPNPIKKKNPEVLRRIREEATRNMCNIPLLQYVRQVIYKESDRIEALNNTFERQKQKFARSMSTRVSTSSRIMKKRTLGPLSRRIFGLSNPDLTGITFNEAGYIESTNVPKPVVVPSPEALKKLQKMKKKKERLMKKKAMENPNLDLIQHEEPVDETFQNLRSLTRDKKRKRPLKEDHITFLRRTMVPGTRIRSRDRQLEWLTAVIRDVKNSRVLVHYEGFPEFFNEWIDINSERLKYDPTLEQRPVPLEGVIAAPSTASTAVAAPSTQAVTLASAVSTVNNETVVESELVESNFEAISDNVHHEEGGVEVHCVQCQVKISQFRIYCMYCEVEAKVEGSERKPFNICLWCFSNAYPEYHDHPRSSFATKVIVGPRGVRPVKGGIITRFEKDLMDIDYKELDRPDKSALVPDLQFQAMMGLETDQGFNYLEQWKDRKVCVFCNDDGTTKDHFIGPQPFLLASTNKWGDTKKRNFWAHDACARHSPEVIQAKDGSWYNVTTAMRRGRTVKCTGCREKGATIGCFDPKCGRSFHVPCTGKPMSHFEDGVIFWCPQHERALMQRDAYDDTFSCDRCSKILGVNPWYTCSKCSEDYFHTFDLCRECFSKDEIGHEHDKEDFAVTSLELMYKEQLEKEAAAAQAIETDEYAPVKKKVVSYKPKMRGLSRLVCSYCWSATSAKWRKGYNGVLMCEDCFSAGPVNDIPMQPPMDLETLPDAAGSIPLSSASMLAAQDAYTRGVGTYATSAEDYSHSPYLTRTAVSAVRFDHSSSQAVYLDSYGPAENQLFSLPIDTTYYDIPGRAPRWATHSGTDYHGTWLPQTVRRAVTKFTNPNDKILSNFLGRGTDAIECFLLGRCCTAVDINPDCVAYSTHIDGDLSRFGNSLEFQREMRSVIRETHRLLKMGRRCTLGIGDNREHCFYIPVSFQLIRQYINEGFELEELIVKRQRYCAMFGLGTYLCVQFDFLCFTHEFIATLRKIPKEEIDTMIIEPDYALLENVEITSTKRAIPSCPIERKSVVMGSVWTFKPTEEYDFPTLCVSRMVERFGRNDANWEEFKLNFKLDKPEDRKVEQWTEQTVEILPPEEDDLVSYERDRLQQIQENNRMLLALGLITDLSETSDDLGHQSKISKDSPCYPPPAQTTLRLIAHIPCTVLKPHQITAYRTTIMQLAKDALEQLPVTGVFIVGTQDIRTETGKLYPLEMLIMEDIMRVVGEDCLKLKELIEAVPDGYQKDRRKITNWGEFKEEPRSPGDAIPIHHLPIVHACYLVFIKVKEKGMTSSGSSADGDGVSAGSEDTH
ncbi:hypothetical protein BGX23_009177 [Mortierella sp. AD031]|nr:hypothetical protein BGX23_009177 [Mortierella sp. AD031]